MTLPRNRGLAAPLLRLYDGLTRLTVTRFRESRDERKNESNLDLPNEILVAVLCRLHHTDLVACRQVRLP